MSTKVDIRWRGDKVTELFTDKAMDTLVKGSAIVEGTTKKLCPVDTGRLRASIGAEELRDELAVEIGTDVEYALPVELGTRTHRAQPYLRPGIRKSMSAIRRLFGHTF